MPKKAAQDKLVIYQTKSGRIEFRGDFKRDTIWGSLNQIARLFGRDKSVISRHIRNIYKAGELDRKSTVAKIATVQREGKREVVREIEYYNLDVILSVGYRVDSKQAAQFRKWATKVLKQHILQGYTINKRQISKNYKKFMQVLSGVKALLPAAGKVKAEDVLEIIDVFASTWLSLDSYDKGDLPKRGASKKQISLTASQLREVLSQFRLELISKGQASEIFGQEKDKDSIEGMVGNIFQSIGGRQVYPTFGGKSSSFFVFYGQKPSFCRRQ